MHTFIYICTQAQNHTHTSRGQKTNVRASFVLPSDKFQHSNPGSKA